MTQKKAVIQVKDLVAKYGEDTILDGISFDVYEGEVFGVLGGSGCGKSTLLKHLIGLLQPYSGQGSESARKWFFRYCGRHGNQHSAP